MSTPSRLAAFAIGLIVAFTGAFGLGRAVGPTDGADPPPPERHTTTTTVEHDGAHP